MRIAHIIAVIACTTLSACSLLDSHIRLEDGVNVPFMKNAANECYYLDEYMPVPDALVKGKNGPLSLRYYTYKAANYKGYSGQNLVLTFYSSDEKCWSLFEEYLTSGWDP